MTSVAMENAIPFHRGSGVLLDCVSVYSINHLLIGQTEQGQWYDNSIKPTVYV